MLHSRINLHTKILFYFFQILNVHVFFQFRTFYKLNPNLEHNTFKDYSKNANESNRVEILAQTCVRQRNVEKISKLLPGNFSCKSQQNLRWCLLTFPLTKVESVHLQLAKLESLSHKKKHIELLRRKLATILRTSRHSR